VRLAEAVARLQGDVQRVAQGQRADARQPLLQLLAGQALHDRERDVVVGVTGVQDLADVRVAQRHHGARLAREAQHGPLVHQLGVQELDGDLAAGRGAPRQRGGDRASGRTHITPERFRLGPTPGAVLELFDRKRTLRSWMSRFTVSTELLTFLCSLYLLVESDIVRFD